MELGDHPIAEELREFNKDWKLLRAVHGSTMRSIVDGSRVTRNTEAIAAAKLAPSPLCDSNSELERKRAIWGEDGTAWTSREVRDDSLGPSHIMDVFVSQLCRQESLLDSYTAGVKNGRRNEDDEQ